MKPPAWTIYGVIAGLFGFGTTLAGNFVIVWLRPSDLCHIGPLIIPLSMLGAVVAFLFFAGAAGFATGLASDVSNEPLLAGILVGALSGCALVALLIFGSSISQRIQELTALCPDGGSISFGSTPPPGALASPPPGVLESPTGPTGLGLSLFSVAITVLLGIGLATGMALVGGIAGRAVSRRAS
ncbi:MAG TPA: hypothetical protein VIT43_06080 [Candidatus Dormibacteraeota bacterium]